MCTVKRPPAFLSLPNPVRKQFKAGRMLPRVPVWLTAKTNYRSYFVATRIVVDANCDYRYVEIDNHEMLLVTPKGLKTLNLKHELYVCGWPEFLKRHPDFHVFTKDQLMMAPIPKGHVFDKPVLAFSRSTKTGALIHAAILYPKVDVLAAWR